MAILPMRYRTFFPFLFLLIVMLFLPLSCAAKPMMVAGTSDLPSKTVGRTTVRWNAADGLMITVDGVPVVRKSTLYIVKKGWSGILFSQVEEKWNIQNWETKPGGDSIAVLRAENTNAVCIYTLTLTPEGGLTTNLRYRLKRDVPAEIEYAAGYLSGTVLENAKYTDAAGVRGTVSVAPPPAERTQEQNRLVPSFTNLKFATRLGGISLDYSGNAPSPVLFDARGDTQEWAQEFPVFWLGIGSPAPPLRFADGEREANFQFRFGNAPVAQSGSPKASEVPLVIPRPKHMTATGEPFPISPQTRIVVGDNASPDDLRGANLLQGEIQAQFGIRVEIVPAMTVTSLNNCILLGEATKNTALTKWLAANKTEVPNKPEGYAVRVTKATVVGAGHDSAGAVWAAQTLIQLFGADQNAAMVQAAQIDDYPTLSLRAVHLFHGKNALPFHEKLIDKVLSRFKMNALFIQAEQLRWDTDPAVAPTWAGNKADIHTEIAYARAHGMTVYPLLESYGHMEWLFNNPRNRAFAEDPVKPYAVNITNPKAVQYLDNFHAEADDLFNAPGFHVGLDEVTMTGRFPYRSKGKFADLFLQNARHWHDFLAKRGKQMFMWADMALYADDVSPTFGTAPSKADAAKIRAGLPKDIVMVDWQYSPHNSYPSLSRLKEAGFKNLVAATWYYPAGIQRFSRAAAQIGAIGAIQTTWAGYESAESVLDTPERRQFIAMVLAADYFWNGGDGPVPAALPYDPAVVFARQWEKPKPKSNP